MAGAAPTNRERFLKLHNLPPDTHLSLAEISKLSGFPKAALTEIYDRGRGAWSSNIKSVRVKGSFKKDPNLRKYPRSARLTPEQWGYGRVYSFVMMRPGTFYKADKDIATRLGFFPR